MLLNPEENEIEVLPPTIQGIKENPGFLNVLGAVGLAEIPDEDLDPELHVQHVFKKHNAGIENAARQVGNLLVSADNDNTKLKAAEMILKIHGILTPEKDDGPSAPQINITIVGSQNKNLINVLIPSH